MIEHSKNCAEKFYDGSEALKEIKKEEEQIQTENGKKKIKDLIIGEDKLKTPSGHWKEVKSKEELKFYEIKIGNEKIIVTEDSHLLK